MQYPELAEVMPDIPVGGGTITEGTRASWAVFSEDRRYRYLLGRQWWPNAPWLCCGMLNPSVAGADNNDPTIRRLLGFARRDNQYGGIMVWNAAALIATDPKELTEGLRHGHDITGPCNDKAIGAALGRELLLHSVVAWGSPRNQRVAGLLRRAFAESVRYRSPRRFGELTKHGWPRHPLYLRADTPIVPY